jgi:3-keto-5-aminohexanoate cleavage enzyme
LNDQLLIVAALNGTRSREECRSVPLTPTELAEEARRAVEAGAGLVHVHARRDNGSSAFDLIVDDIVAAIRAAVDVPISLSTQRGRQTSLGTVTALFGVLADLPDVATVHVRPPAGDAPAHREEARQIIEALDAAGVRPAPVAGSLDALGDLEALYGDSLLGRAPYLALRFAGEHGDDSDLTPGTPGSVLRLIDAAATVFSHLPVVVSGTDATSPIAQAIAAAAGAHVRVGLADTATLPDGAPATSSAQLVAHAVALGAALGRAPMTPAEVRTLLR